ncbi:DedA family protein [Paludibacter sp.]
MEGLIEFSHNMVDPDRIMENGGLYVVTIILFIETGIIIGFMLPGDAMLFISGMLISSVDVAHYPFSNELINLIFWMILFIVAAVNGNFFGYWFGSKFSSLLEIKQDTWYLKQKHIYATKNFYKKRGSLTIVIARFLPIVRTFAPIVGGAVNMDFKKFATYNILGALIWVCSFTIAGYIMGDNRWVQNNLLYVILGIFVLVTLPVIFKFANNKLKHNTKISH